jgi:hypothetical protein
VRHDIAARKTTIQLKVTCWGARQQQRGLQVGAGGDVHLAVPLRSAMSVITSGRLQLLGVDGTQQRGTQTGSRAEAGIRFAGEKGQLN